MLRIERGTDDVHQLRPRYRCCNCMIARDVVRVSPDFVPPDILYSHLVEIADQLQCDAMGGRDVIWDSAVLTRTQRGEFRYAKKQCDAMKGRPDCDDS